MFLSDSYSLQGDLVPDTVMVGLVAGELKKMDKVRSLSSYSYLG